MSSSSDAEKAWSLTGSARAGRSVGATSSSGRSSSSRASEKSRGGDFLSRGPAAADILSRRFLGGPARLGSDDDTFARLGSRAEGEGTETRGDSSASVRNCFFFSGVRASTKAATRARSRRESASSEVSSGSGSDGSGTPYGYLVCSGFGTAELLSPATPSKPTATGIATGTEEDVGTFVSAATFFSRETSAGKSPRRRAETPRRRSASGDGFAARSRDRDTSARVILRFSSRRDSACLCFFVPPPTREESPLDDASASSDEPERAPSEDASAAARPSASERSRFARLAPR
mmetsp:Transcript_11605/g.49521  ORF Transcript_11605/g.49521 Transcript_11605/m.49521 type:complete len:291 (+) Transcript_11605:1361-2233(+)